jgi:hypothetical protein
MKLYVMDTFVRSCRTPEGALELARFMECKFPLDRKSVLSEGEQLHKFVVAVPQDGRFEVHSTVPVNDLGREDFRKYVLEFLEMKSQRHRKINR